MASGQKVIGRHEVFEYTYRMGPAAEERKRIKLVVIQRREQRRKSQIGVSKHLGTPVRLRVNLHRAQYGDPEIVSGSRHVPITLRRKAKPAPNTTVLRHAPRAPAKTVVRAPASPSPPPPPGPTRIELVDSPVGSYVDDPPPPIVVVPPSQSPTPEPPTTTLVRTPSGSSIGRKPKRSNSITSGFRRFPSLMGMIRRNSKSSTPPSVAASEEQHVIVPGNYFDRDLPQTPESLVIVEERESELGSPIGTSVRYGPPSVADTSISRRRPPPTVESIGSSRSGRSRNKLIKPPPHQVPLPDSLRHSDGTGTVASGYPAHVRQSAEYEPARSVTSRHTGERLITGPEYAESYLHDSPSARSRSLHNESVKGRSIHDGASARSHNRSLHDLSQHNRSAHDLSQHSRSVHDLSMRTPSRHSHEASVRDGSFRDGISLHELGGAPSLRGESIRDPSIREHSVRDASIRDPSIREHSLRGGGSIRDGGLYSPGVSVREVLSDGDRENDHAYDYERGSHLHSRVASPSLHAPSTRVASPNYYRDGSPSIHAPSHRAMSPSVLAPSHRGASPSLHAPSYRGASPSLHAPSRGASPSLHDPSIRGGSPPVSMHAPSERSRVAPSVVSSKYPPSSMNGRHNGSNGFGRPKSPLSASGSSHASSRRTNGPRGPDITAVPLPPQSVVSAATTRNGLKSPLSRVASPPISEAPIIPSRSAPSVDGSYRSGRASELPYQATLPPSTYAPSAISRAPSAAAISRAPSAAGSRIPISSRAPSAAGVPTAPSAGTFHSAVSEAPSRAPSAAGTHITRAPSAAGVPLPSSVGTRTVYAPSESGYSRAPSAAGPRITRVPSAAGVALPPSVAGSTIYAPSTIGRARSPSVAGTQIARAPSAAGVPLPPSVVGSPTVYAPSARGHSRAPSVAGTQITRATSAARVPLPASVVGGSTVYAPSVAGHSRAPSAAGISRAPSAAGPRITRVPSAAGTHRQAPSVSVSQRIPPSVIGSQRVPPSITGSAPSRHTPPPESEFLPAQSDIAPESESHGGQALRAQARLEGDKMGMFFQMAQQAHKDGDGARAKELSDIGRQHQVRMQELNAEAASQIFKEKNAGRDENEIDLHGLYVKEALVRLSQFIREAPRSGQTSLRIITGKGLHSDRGEAQIIPAVEGSLRTKGLRHHTDESNAGVIVVELGPRSPVSD